MAETVRIKWWAADRR